MIDSFLLSILWISLVGLNGLISVRLALMYRKDYDKRKLMFIIGLILTSHAYLASLQGINSSPLMRRVFEWCSLPLVFAFLFSVFNDRFNLDLSKCYKIFLGLVTVTIGLFFIPLPFPSMIILFPGVIFSLILAFTQYTKQFDLSSVTLILSLPIHGVYYMGMYFELPELAIFSAFIGTTFVLLAFEVAKTQTGITSSPLLLQQKLETAQTNFSVLFNLLPDPAVIIDHRGNFLEITDAVTDATGLSREEFIGTNFVNLPIISKKSKARMITNLAKRMIGLTIEPYEIEINRKDGKKLFFELNASKIEYDGKAGNLVLFRDLTDRYNLINSLAEQEERFSDIANNTGDWIWEVDQNGKFVYTNSCVEKIIGYTSEEIIGKRFIDFLLPNYRESSIAFLNEPIKKKESFVFEARCFHKSGQVVVLDTRAVSIFDESGTFVGYRGVIRDVTEKIEMQEKLVKSERLAAVGELATMVAHDLRNPLQSIATAMYCLEKVIPEEKNEKAKKLVATVKDALSYSDKIVRELFAYSSKINLEFTKTKPRELIRKALLTINIPSNVEFVNRTQDKPVVFVDANKIRRICVNIISNALDAMPDGGTLTVSCITVNENLELSFSDTGIGMTPEHIKKLMNPFFTTKAKGMGLGLAISKRIAEAHHGTITVISEIGKGTTFTLVLPIKKPQVTTQSSNDIQQLQQYSG
ncbi:MAG: PAS domain S-box protein [Candidatus Bathyarchaeota archaeon]|nr:PAS domain S-box protein [Candidatus Bathyarchaeum tardum]WGM90094.1 MAG: PAS domain S-box protein [Candidatus Bathyarchaeum tardum]WNZ29768.1 MAG: PAS domain S-box protein [Candidatus Bathyarchaeota archaeon]